MGVVLGVVSPDLSIGEGTISPLPIYLLRAFRLRMALPSMLRMPQRDKSAGLLHGLLCVFTLHPGSQERSALQNRITHLQI